MWAFFRPWVAISAMLKIVIYRLKSISGSKHHTFTLCDYSCLTTNHRCLRRRGGGANHYPISSSFVAQLSRSRFINKHSVRFSVQTQCAENTRGMAIHGSIDQSETECRRLYRSANSPATLSMRRWPSVDLMLGQRRRRWPNIKSTLCQCLLHLG